MLCCFVPQPWLSVSLASTIPYPHIMFDIPFVHLIPNLPRQSADASAGSGSSSLAELLEERRYDQFEPPSPAGAGTGAGAGAAAAAATSSSSISPGGLNFLTGTLSNSCSMLLLRFLDVGGCSWYQISSCLSSSFLQKLFSGSSKDLYSAT